MSGARCSPRPGLREERSKGGRSSRVDRGDASSRPRRVAALPAPGRGPAEWRSERRPTYPGRSGKPSGRSRRARVSVSCFAWQPQRSRHPRSQHGRKARRCCRRAPEGGERGRTTEMSSCTLAMAAATASPHRDQPSRKNWCRAAQAAVEEQASSSKVDGAAAVAERGEKAASAPLSAIIGTCRHPAHPRALGESR